MEPEPFCVGDRVEECEMKKLELSENIDKVLVSELICRVYDDQADAVLVGFVGSEMRKRLAQKRSEGRGGWFGPNCTNNDLRDMLVENLQKGDMIDVINIAGMILARERIWGKSA